MSSMARSMSVRRPNDDSREVANDDPCLTMKSNDLLFVGHGVVSYHEIDLTHLPNVVDMNALATNQTAAELDREMKLVDDDLLLFGLLKRHDDDEPLVLSNMGVSRDWLPYR